MVAVHPNDQANNMIGFTGCDKPQRCSVDIFGNAFCTHMDAMNAYNRLQRPDVIFGTDRTEKMAFAEPLREPDKEITTQVKSMYVDGIPTFWDED
jgi:hypothetical protein